MNQSEHYWRKRVSILEAQLSPRSNKLFWQGVIVGVVIGWIMGGW